MLIPSSASSAPSPLPLPHGRQGRKTGTQSTKHSLGHAPLGPALCFVVRVSEEEDEETAVGELGHDGLEEVAGHSRSRSWSLVFTGGGEGNYSLLLYRSYTSAKKHSQIAIRATNVNSGFNSQDLSTKTSLENCAPHGTLLSRKF